MNVNELTRIPGTPRSSFGHVLHADRLYILGGHPGMFHKYDAANFSAEMHVLDIGLNKWQTLRPLPVPMQGFRVVANGTYLYAFGGFAPDSRIPAKPWPASSRDRVLRYSISSDIWEDIGAMPRRRSSYVCASLGTKTYLIGGWDATPSELGDIRGRFVKPIDVFDVVNERFLPSCLEFQVLRLRRAFSATIYRGKLVVAGGLGTEGFMSSDLLADVLAYEPPSAECDPDPNAPAGRYLQGSWTQLPFLSTPLFSPGVGVRSADLLIAGGVEPLLQPYSGLSSAKLFLLKSGASSWEQLPVQMSEARSFVEVQELATGSVALIGGHHGMEADALPSNLIEVLS